MEISETHFSAPSVAIFPFLQAVSYLWTWLPELDPHDMDDAPDAWRAAMNYRVVNALGIAARMVSRLQPEAFANMLGDSLNG